MSTIVAIMMLLFSLLAGGSEEGETSGKQLTELLAAAQQIGSGGGQDSGGAENSGGTGDSSETGDGQEESVAVPTDVADPSVKRDPQPDTPAIKGIYVTSHSAGGERMEQLLKLLDETALNSMVIDIKDDFGYITYPTDNEQLLQLGTIQRNIRDIQSLMNRLTEHEVYPIARIVVFKDSLLADKHPELSFVQKDGTVWQNNRKESFVNPYLREVWDYNVAIAREAAALGFKEIQFDYVRFPEGFEKREDSLTFHTTEESRTDVIAGFVAYAREQLEPLGVRVSVDIFGYAASVPAAEGIGQDFVKISDHVHVISPMVYPSHYTTGWFGQKTPDLAPYETIKGAMEDTHSKLEPLGDDKPIIRPWIQDFTATWLGKGNYTSYGKVEVEAQIRALADSGVHEYLLWNARNSYTEDAEF